MEKNKYWLEEKDTLCVVQGVVYIYIEDFYTYTFI